MSDALIQDLRYAFRALRSSPGFATVAILSLALGIGANTAIFSLIDSVMLKTLPVKHPEQVLQVTRGKEDYYTNLIWEQVRDRQDVFSGIFAYSSMRFDLAAGGESRYAEGNYVAGRARVLTHFVAGFLYGMKSDDPVTLCLAAAVLALVAAVAGFVPAGRASRLDPMEALREE